MILRPIDGIKTAFYKSSYSDVLKGVIVFIVFTCTDVGSCLLYIYTSRAYVLYLQTHGL